MFKKFAFAAFLALSIFVPAPAQAQSGCQYIVYGAVLTAGQWNACFAAKNNTLGYTPVNKAGDTMSGKLNLPASGTLASGFNLGVGFSPNSPINGDLWINNNGLNFQLAGATIGPHNTPTYTGGSAPSLPLTYSFWNNTAGATVPYNIFDGSQWVNIGTLDPATHTWTAASGSAVTSFSGGTTGLLPSSASTGAITLTGTLLPANGGTGITSLGTGIATWLGTPSSANLRSALTDETGTGAAFFAGGNAGAFTATSINGVTISSTTGTLTVANGKTLTANNSLTLAGTDGTTMTFPTTTATLARTDAGQTFTGTNAFGVLTATSFNGNTFTSGTGVLTLGAGKTLTSSNTLTLTATDGSTLAIGAGGTLGSNAYTSTAFAPIASPTFTGTATTPALTVSGITGSTQCLQANTSGVVSGTGLPCAAVARNFYYSGAGFSPAALTTAVALQQFGLGSSWTITPAVGGSGRVEIMVTGYGSCSSPAGGQYLLNGTYGTGTAPSNAAAATGTAIMAATGIAGASSGDGSVPFTIFAEISGLSAGTPVWFDLVGRRSGTCAGNVSANVATVRIQEVR